MEEEKFLLRLVLHFFELAFLLCLITFGMAVLNFQGNSEGAQNALDFLLCAGSLSLFPVGLSGLLSLKFEKMSKDLIALYVKIFLVGVVYLVCYLLSVFIM